MGPLYATSAVVLGAGFVGQAVALAVRPTFRSSMRLFRYSISYLALLFGAIAVDTLERFGA
jgi:protoheme IX farnesyltransferase